MGIKGILRFLKDNAPECIKEVSPDVLHGKTVVIDASIAMY